MVGDVWLSPRRARGNGTSSSAWVARVGEQHWIFFKVRTGEGFVMLHDGQRVGANQRISTSTALGIMRAQQGAGGGAPRPSEWGKRLELPWVVRDVLGVHIITCC